MFANTEELPGKKVIAFYGVVSGSTVRAKHVGRDLMAGIKSIFGRHAEKKHYKSILERERYWLKFPTTCSKYLLVLEEDRKIDRSDLVNGSMVVSVDFFKRILAKLRDFFRRQSRVP